MATKRGAKRKSRKGYAIAKESREKILSGAEGKRNKININDDMLELVRYNPEKEQKSGDGKLSNRCMLGEFNVRRLLRIS